MKDKKIYKYVRKMIKRLVLDVVEEAIKEYRQAIMDEIYKSKIIFSERKELEKLVIDIVRRALEEYFEQKLNGNNEVKEKQNNYKKNGFYKIKSKRPVKKEKKEEENVIRLNNIKVNFVYDPRIEEVVKKYKEENKKKVDKSSQNGVAIQQQEDDDEIPF
ncbi:MAG: hypothetical protein ABIL45_04185 [candidate division WOR-3 bacterium]